MENTILTQNNLLQGLALINQTEYFQSDKIIGFQNKIENINDVQTQLNPYLLNFQEVKQVLLKNSSFKQQHNLGFLNFTGLMINFQFLYSIDIQDTKFDDAEQNLPTIQVTNSLSTTITNLFVDKMTSQSFIFISLVDQLKLKNINFSKINEPIRFKLESTLDTQMNNYLLSLGGINNFELQNLQISFCNNIGMINLVQFVVGQNAIQNSNIFNANSIKIITSFSSINKPMINLNNKQTNISLLFAKEITSYSHFINLYSQKQFIISYSQFSNIELNNFSTTIKSEAIEMIKISEVKFFYVTSLLSPALLLIKSVDSVIIEKGQFRKNKNNHTNNDKNAVYDDNQGIVNLQNCQSIDIVESIFVSNTCFGNGGALYLNKIQQSTIKKSYFILNQAELNSGGAIFASNSDIQIIETDFKDNISKQERGGAIYSDNTEIQIISSHIINNIAYVGGGIYYNKIDSIKIDKTTQIYANKGRFYGNNKGSYPKKLLKVDLKTKQVYSKIIIQNFQSGNYTKQPIYVQYFDEENKMLNFNIADQINQFSQSILQEIESYKISIDNFSQIENLTIILGQQLQYIKTINLFQLNITAGNYHQTDFQLALSSNSNGKQLTLALLLNFRKCKIGQILYPKQSYISCDSCSLGTYSLIDPYEGQQNNQVQCKKCPSQYAQKCYSNQIILFDNFWRESNETDVIYSCDMQGCSVTDNNQINGCVKGYIGPLCSSCDYKGIFWGKSYAQKGKQCLECGQIVDMYIFLGLTIIFYSIYIAVSVNKQVETNLQIIKIQYLRRLQVLFLRKTVFIGSDTGILLKIFFHYLQIFSSSIDVFNQIPDLIGNFFKLGGDPTQITYTSLDCIYKDWILNQLWFDRLTMQLAQIIIITVLVLLSRYFLRKTSRQFYKMKIYLIFIYFFYYSSLVKMLVSFCLCKTIGSSSYMLNDFLQKCWTNQHILFSIGIIYPLTIICSVGIPLVFYFKIKHAIQGNKQENIQFVLSYYFILQGYKNEFYFWEILKMFQRLIIMIVLNLDIQNGIQRQLILVICFVYLMVTIQLNPYKQKQLQNLEILLTIIVIVSLAIQTVIYLLDDNPIETLILVIIILILNLYNLLKIILEYYESSLSLALRSKMRKLKAFLTLLYKLRIINIDIKKNQISLLRISYLWKAIRKNLHLLNNEIIISRKYFTTAKSQKNLTIYPSTFQDLYSVQEQSLED